MPSKLREAAAGAGCLEARCSGCFFRRIVPEHHLGADSKDVIKVAMGLLATMSALVLALLISSAKTSHDTQSNEVGELCRRPPAGQVSLAESRCLLSGASSVSFRFGSPTRGIVNQRRAVTLRRKEDKGMAETAKPEQT